MDGDNRYYQDPEYGDWVVITAGKNPLRTWYSDLAMLKGNWPDLNRSHRIPKPPNSSPANWWNGKYWRQEPARRWAWDREGIHAVKGAINGLPVALALWLFADPWVVFAMLALSALFFVRFLAYEVTESNRIRDRAYRDLAGEMIAFMVITIPPALRYVFNFS